MLKMSNNNLIKKAINTADNLYFNEKHLAENCITIDNEWVKTNKITEEDFKELIKENNKLYKQLAKYKDELVKRVIITKTLKNEEYEKIIKTINERINSN